METAALSDSSAVDSGRHLFPPEMKLFAGETGLIELLNHCPNVDLVVNSLVGAAGLLPTVKALEMGITVALANKESLVMAGKLMFDIAERTGAGLIPIDSEHSAIFQCLLGEDHNTVAKLILTASGGPFFRTPLEKLHDATPAEALQHPSWNMGNRITIDSATMLNKGLEVIEAHWLFNIPAEDIEVIIHPQSIVHSLVRFKDGSYIAQMGAPDMRLPIQFAMTYPERLQSPYCRLDFDKTFNLEFHPVPMEKYPCLELSFMALRKGGVSPAVLNAADETAVKAFLKKRIKFTDIPKIIESVLHEVSGYDNPSLDDIMRADAEARRAAERIIGTVLAR